MLCQSKVPFAASPVGKTLLSRKPMGELQTFLASLFGPYSVVLGERCLENRAIPTQLESQSVSENFGPKQGPCREASASECSSISTSTSTCVYIYVYTSIYPSIHLSVYL